MRQRLLLNAQVGGSGSLFPLLHVSGGEDDGEITSAASAPWRTGAPAAIDRRSASAQRDEPPSWVMERRKTRRRCRALLLQRDIRRSAAPNRSVPEPVGPRSDTAKAERVYEVRDGGGGRLSHPSPPADPVSETWGSEEQLGVRSRLPTILPESLVYLPAERANPGSRATQKGPPLSDADVLGGQSWKPGEPGRPPSVHDTPTERLPTRGGPASGAEAEPRPFIERWRAEPVAARCAVHRVHHAPGARRHRAFS
ncbi:hypothetical protein AAFF_G00073780 [Aldrovandia affinis]|uniref:Uncharacterized protein n=1 Tax=Aldrovandia affinis TaxID=143900 RepID=A0AAD7RY74_9TELE|nr:hypothetical protein AAFF_G00073780 [Aldrovandia affinis]